MLTVLAIPAIVIAGGWCHCGFGHSSHWHGRGVAATDAADYPKACGGPVETLMIHLRGKGPRLGMGESLAIWLRGKGPIRSGLGAQGSVP